MQKERNGMMNNKLAVYRVYIRKGIKLLRDGKIWELIRSVLSKVPAINKAGFNLTLWFLRRKYSALVDAHQPTRKILAGGHKNIIWWFWYQGIDQAPDLCKACLASLKRWHPDKEIIILDKYNLSQYVTFPDYITRKHEQGIISHTHFSDLVRLQLLIEHGGTWIDATIFCTGRKYAYIMDLPLFLFRWTETGVTLSNCFIVSDPHDPILTLTRDLLFAYWRDYNFLIHYFVFYLFFKMAAEKYKDDYDKIPFLSSGERLHAVAFAVKNGEEYSEERMKHFVETSDFHKLTHKEISSTQWKPSGILPHLLSDCM